MLEGNDNEAAMILQMQQQQLEAQLIIEQNRSIEAANLSIVALNESRIALQQAEPAEEKALRLEQLEKINKLQVENLKTMHKFANDQLNNLQTTVDIMFRQANGAAWMFYGSFLLGVALIIAGVTAYFLFRDSNNLLILAFFGAGALAMLSFFLRDPAVKVQQTAAKLVQLQIAMRLHLTEIGYWEIYIAQKREAGKEITIADLEIASQTIRSSALSIMEQIDDSIDDLKKAGKDDDNSVDDSKKDGKKNDNPKTEKKLSNN